MGVPEVFERPTRDPRLGTPDRPAKIARVAMPEARVGAKGARPVGPGRVTTARRPARAADAAAVAATEVSRVGAVDRPRRRRRGLSEAERILRVLRSRSGTRAAVQMAEILAPPVALRDDHLRR